MSAEWAAAIAAMVAAVVGIASAVASVWVNERSTTRTLEVQRELARQQAEQQRELARENFQQQQDEDLRRRRMELYDEAVMLAHDAERMAATGLQVGMTIQELRDRTYFLPRRSSMCWGVRTMRLRH